MQLYDLVMIAVLGIAVFFGYWKGFAWQVASLAAIIASYLVARNFHEPVAQMIGGDPSWNRFLAMFILFLGTSLVIWLGFGFVKSTIQRMHLHGFDRQFGALLGGVKGLLICVLVTLFGVSLLGENACRMICTSYSGNYIARVLGHADGVVPEEIGQYINPYIEKFHGEMAEHKGDAPASGLISDSLKQEMQKLLSNPHAAQSWDGPNAHVGQLQTVPGGGQDPQSVFQGALNSWGNSGANPQSQIPNASGSGTFQAPTINAASGWQSAPATGQQAPSLGESLLNSAGEAAQKALEDRWKKAMEGDR